ncbi:DnaB-like helicase C-terminal domain-containing protein [Mycoplasmopsis columbinasalis]|uniref:Replicative DNA helicase n=1 Tax=Mycoplasmopsis columbinasalis TaxID=114880 RepID=A0A449BB34_9BACT|nr:DnaB-like helicase C-terminal domain-containing protein [Mycoplasmopsis columbinasalis]VEU78392.1 Replicative DNA helicase [Mycoplasmopsis columbinasalis]
MPFFRDLFRYKVERAVLSVVLNNYDYNHYAAEFSPANFKVPEYQVLFEILEKLFDNCQVYSTQNIVDCARKHNFTKFYFNIYGEVVLTSIENEDYFLQEFAKFVVIDKITALFQTWRETKFSFDFSRNVLKQTLNLLAENLSQDKIAACSIDEYLDNFRLTFQNQEKTISTQWALFDTNNQGLRPGELIVIGARPGIGKTALATNLILNARKANKTKLNILFVSLEMTKQEILSRLVANLTQLPLWMLNSKNWQATPTNEQAIDKAIAYIEKHLNLRILEPTAQHLIDSDYLTNEILELKTQWDIDLIILDHLQIMKFDEKTIRTYALSDTVNKLKLIAKSLEIPFVLLSQLNRESDTQQMRPTSANLKDSGAIEQIADQIVLMYKEFEPKLINQLQRNKKSQLLCCDLIKNRNGTLRRAYMEFRGETMTFNEVGIMNEIE